MKKILCILAIPVLLNACASYAPAGAIYTNVKTATFVDNNVKASKTGKACMTSILALVATGDSSIAAAKLNGGITKIATVDYEVSNKYLGIYGEYCTVITGN